MPEYRLKDKELPAFGCLDEFTQGYTEEFIAVCESGENEGTIPSDVSWLDIDSESMKVIERDCESFQIDNQILLLQSLESDAVGGYTVVQAGRDFWYTRNGHGTGFWDRELGEVGDKLSGLCGFQTKYSEVWLQFDLDNKKIYL